jgi:hypothetical protein
MSRAACYTINGACMTIRRLVEADGLSLGRWSRQDVDHMLSAAARIPTIGSRIAFISEQFLGVPYRESTLKGDANTPELLTINLEAVDCFTYLDYVEAMRRSHNIASFTKMLRMVRYRGGKVGYITRNHFFTDWLESNTRIKDVTADVGGKIAEQVHKRINDRGGGICFVEGTPPVERNITYIPGKTINDAIIRRLKTGDYIGIYSRMRGLDVSHVGILIKTKGGARFRHASSLASQRRVIDQDFKTYVTFKPGIIALRPVA